MTKNSLYMSKLSQATISTEGQVKRIGDAQQACMHVSR